MPLGCSRAAEIPIPAHKIPLVDSKKQDNYYAPRCPDYLKPELLKKIRTYEKAGWWQQTHTPQAAPMLCIAKKDGTLRTVVDCRKRNENTVKDVTLQH